MDSNSSEVTTDSEISDYLTSEESNDYESSSESETDQESYMKVHIHQILILMILLKQIQNQK